MREQVQFPATACLASGMSHHGRMLCYALAPLVLVSVLRLPSLYASVSKKVDDDTAKVALKLFWESALFFMVVFAYPACSRVAVQSVPWACDDVGLAGRYLHVDYLVDCDSNDFKSISTPIAVVFVLVWPIGMLGLLLFLIWRYKVQVFSRTSFYVRMHARTHACTHTPAGPAAC